METVMPALEEILTPPDDGVVKLKAQELQLRAQENQDDKEIAEKKLALDKAKLRQKDESEEEKLKSQEDIAVLKMRMEEEKISSQEDMAALKASVERERIAKDKKEDKKDGK